MPRLYWHRFLFTESVVVSQVMSLASIRNRHRNYAIMIMVMRTASGQPKEYGVLLQ